MNKKNGEKELIIAASGALKNSFSPHSGFKVGAAILGSSGKIYCGTNAEFDAYSLTMCAERTALFSGITSGERSFMKMAIITSSNKFKFPCGLCRQALIEFNPNLEIILMTKNKAVKRFILKDIMPYHFKL